MDDQQLLREFKETGSDAAFRQLVERHLNLVYSTARRRMGDADRAQDVAQQVFVLLARKARWINPRVVLSGWLYRATCHVSSETRRRESRRQVRDRAAADAMSTPESHAAWQDIEPLLDDAMSDLARADRDAVVLRYFENKSLREVGEVLGISDDAAQKRLSRAVRRLRLWFERRQRPIADGLLTAAIGVGAIQAAPVGLAATISAASLSGLVLSASNLSLLMSSISGKAVATGAVVLAATSVLVVESVHVARLRHERAGLTQRLAVAESAAADARRLLQDSRVGAERDPRIGELARLRGEVATLRRERASTAAENADLREALRHLQPSTSASEAQDAVEQDPEATRVTSLGIAKLEYTKRWGLAFHQYAQAQGGRMPGSLEQAARYFPTHAEPAQEVEGQSSPAMSVDPRTLGLAVALPDGGASHLTVLSATDYEIVYQGALDQVADPARTIVLREKEPQTMHRGVPARAYLFADGHSEIHAAPDGDFTRWEQERMVPSTP